GGLCSSGKSSPDAVMIKPSASIILTRHGARQIESVLMRRYDEMAFSSGWVLPGSKIDPEDYRCVKEVCTGEELEISAALHAAVRETQEEAGVTIPVEELVLMSCWTTPVLGDRPRFRTWFFVAPMNEQVIVVDGNEM